MMAAQTSGLPGQTQEMPQTTFLFTLKFPMRFSASTKARRRRTFTYSTFGILRFTVLSRLGRQPA
jgi:hypothetical protein